MLFRKRFEIPENIHLHCSCRNCDLKKDSQVMINVETFTRMMTVTDFKKEIVIDFYFNKDSAKKMIKHLKKYRW